MGSKKFRNKDCAYCPRPSVTGDHVIAREFFPIQLRGNLPKVPACSDCNVKKSALEQYLVTVLPVAGRHASIGYGLDELSGRLRKNQSLERELAAVFNSYGEIGPERKRVVGVRYPCIEQYIKYVARGLFYWETGASLGEAFEVMVQLALRGAASVDSVFEGMEGGNISVRRFVDGGLSYRVWMNESEPRISMWHIQLYAGLSFAQPADLLKENGYDFVAITGPRGSVRAIFERVKASLENPGQRALSKPGSE